MADKDAKQNQPQTVTDEQITTVNKLPRRSFLSATGALLAGAVAVGAGASAQQSNPGSKKKTDPDTADKKKGSDPDKNKAADQDQTDKKKTPAKAKSNRKASDPDKKKATDPDKKPTDPDRARR